MPDEEEEFKRPQNKIPSRLQIGNAPSPPPKPVPQPPQPPTTPPKPQPRASTVPSEPPKFRTKFHPFVQSIEEADIEQPLADAKELGAVPIDELDAIGMVYEGAKFGDMIINNFIMGCRRIINHFVGNGNGSQRFNKVLDMSKHVARGTGVFAKALHSYSPFRRKINMVLTRAIHARWGGGKRETMDVYQELYRAWQEYFLKPYLEATGIDDVRALLVNREMIDGLIMESSSWMQEQFTIEGEEDDVRSLSAKFLSNYARDVGVAKTPWYEILESKGVPRPPPTEADLERERIVKERGLMGQIDVDLLVRPNRKKRRR